MVQATVRRIFARPGRQDKFMSARESTWHTVEKASHSWIFRLQVSALWTQGNQIAGVKRSPGPYITRFRWRKDHSVRKMAAHLIVASLVALLCIAQPGFSRPEEAASPNYQDLIKQLQATISKTLDDAKKSLNLPNEPNADAVIKAIKEQAQKAETSLTEMKSRLEEQMKSNPQMQEVIKNLQSKVDEASANLKKANLDVTANNQKIIDTLKSSYESIGKEMERINSEVNTKGGLKDDLENLIKGLVDRGSAAAKEFQAKIQDAVSQAAKKN